MRWLVMVKIRIAAAAPLLIASLALPSSATARAEPQQAPDYVRQSAPALARYTQDTLFGDLWKRSDLSPRDRSFITVATLIATGKDDQLGFHIGRALDNGVTPAEIGGIITQLAFYAGWPNAMSAAKVADQVFKERGIKTAAAQPARAAMRAAPEGDGKRSQSVREGVGTVAPTLAEMTNKVLFDDLWRRTDLSPRDRSLATITALTAGGDAAQLGFHLKTGLSNGLTRDTIGAAMAQIAFYAGWPKGYSGATALLDLEKGR
ncbi:carboxymuconolactone decarboxylase family protein [Sphingomonas sp. ac-8]|uniref:carboxymuconolactone decarboxylase family protein n=1 Tax=Sphingomonas sp. ac-8 TaxID=3242977 RepID=UPI003A81245D